MYLTSSAFLQAIRRPHTKITTAVHRNLITGVRTDLPIVDGTITEDVTAQIRRVLTLTIPNTQALWDTLNSPGGEVTVTQGMRFVNRRTEWVPMGVFVVDKEHIGYSQTGDIAMTCADRWLHVQRNAFGLSRASVGANLGWQEIKRLVEGAFPSPLNPFPGWASIDTSAATKVGYRYYDDGSRENAVNGLLVANTVEVLFDRTGRAVLQKIPALTNTSPSVWTVDATATGVMLDADRDRDRGPVRNALIISSSAADVTFAPVEVVNNTVGDPLAITGPLGYVPEEWSSADFRNSTQATAAGKTRLAKSLGEAQQLGLEAVGNPALDAEDVITAVLPRIDRNTPRPTELHIIDALTHPLSPRGTQTITTRTTRAA